MVCECKPSEEIMTTEKMHTSARTIAKGS